MIYDLEPYHGKNARNIPVSYSEISMYKECKRKWWLTYYRGLSPLKYELIGPLPLGTRVHFALERKYKHGENPVTAYTRQLNIDRGVFESGPDGQVEEKVKKFNDEAELGRLMVEGYEEWLEESGEDDKYSVLAVEKEVSHPFLDGRFRVRGKVDLKVEDNIDGAILSMDHKALWVDEQILTPSGFRRIGDIKQGDNVFTPTGKITKVKGVYPQGKVHLNTVEFSDKTSVRACDDHLWQVSRYNDKTKTLTTSEIAMTMRTYGTKNYYWKIPQINELSIDFENTSVIPIHPYIIGVWLAEGTKGTPNFTTSDEYIRNKVNNLLPETLKLSHNYVGDKYKHAIISTNGRNTIFLSTLRGLGLLGTDSSERFIPAEYKTRPAVDRLELLRGIMDGDGYVRSINGAVVLSCTSTQLVDDVAWLARSLGAFVTVQETPSKSYAHNRNGTKKRGKDVYFVSIRFNQHVCPFSLPSKVDKYNTRKRQRGSKFISSITNAGFGEAVCIEVEDKDSLYITTNFTVTHNTSARPSDFNTIAMNSEQLMMYTLLEKLNNEDGAPVEGGIYSILKKVKRTKNAKPPFYTRIVVRFNDDTMKSYWTRLNGTLRDMIRTRDELDAGADHRYVAYPTPTKDCAWKCPFFQVCPLFDDGSAAESMLYNHFTIKNPYERYENDETEQEI